MNCPKCKTNKLKKGKIKQNGIEINYCAKCKGIWFDHGEIEQMLSSPVKNLSIDNRKKHPSGVCPSCSELLYEFYYPQTFVNIDMCGKCKGIWVDAGELKEIRAVRESLKKTGEAKDFQDPTGIKGALLGFIENALNNAGTF